MKGKTVVITAVISALIFVQVAEAQINKVPRIGFLFPGSLSYAAPNIEAFRQGLRELGYVEGNNIVIEYRVAGGKSDRYSQLAAELVNLRVDVLVTASTPAIQALKNATSTIPIVMAAAADPVRTGLIASLANPGRNITGLSMRSPEVSGKRLELIKGIVPKTQRVGILLTEGNAASETSLEDSQVAAQAIGLQLQSVKIRGPNDIDAGLDELIRSRIDAFTVFRESLLLVHLNRLLVFAEKNRLPAVYDGREFALAGGLMSYTSNHLDLYRRSATYVDKILKGTRPADLPVEQAMRAEFIINLRGAKKIGLTIPLEVLQTADKVIR
jgi:putative ABC transport system substrate-binding protein